MLCVPEADADGRHDIHEITRHDCACRATTPRNMTTRKASTMQVRGTLRHALPRCECTSLRTHSTWRQTSPRVKQGREASMRRHHFHTLAQVCKSRAVQLCIRSAKPACSQALAGTGWKYHKANATITEIQLWGNDIGDGGAIALAESLKATLVMRFRPVRATLFSWPARTQPHRRVICVTSVFRCWSVGVARCGCISDVFLRQDVVRSCHPRVHLRRFMRLKPLIFRQALQA